MLSPASPSLPPRPGAGRAGGGLPAGLAPTANPAFAAHAGGGGMRLLRESHNNVRRSRQSALGATNRPSEGAAKRVAARLEATRRGMEGPKALHAPPSPAAAGLDFRATTGPAGKDPDATPTPFMSTTGSLDDLLPTHHGGEFASPVFSPSASMHRIQQGLNVDPPSFDLGDPRRALSPPPGGWRNNTGVRLHKPPSALAAPNVLLRRQPEPSYRNLNTQGGAATRITSSLRQFQSDVTGDNPGFPRPPRRAHDAYAAATARVRPGGFTGQASALSLRRVKSGYTPKPKPKHGYDGEYAGLYERVSRDLQQRGQTAETAFAYFDRDQDGKLSVQDVSTAMRALSMPVTKRGREAFAHELLEHAATRKAEKTGELLPEHAEASHLTKEDIDAEVIHGGYQQKGGKMRGTHSRVHNAFEICFARNRDQAIYMEPSLYAHDREANAVGRHRVIARSLPPIALDDPEATPLGATHTVPPYAAVCSTER